MSTPAAARVLRKLRASGWKLTAVGNRIRFEPDRDDAPDLSAVQQDWLREHKAELLAVLRKPDPIIAIRFTVGPCGCGTAFYLADDSLRCWFCDAPAWAEVAP